MKYDSNIQNTPGPSTWFPRVPGHYPYAPEHSLDDQLIQHTVTRVQRLEEDTTTLSKIQSELENIGDSFYSLADLVSVL